MPYGSYSYGNYSGIAPQAPQQAEPSAGETQRQQALKQALTELVRSFTKDPAELLAPQEGPAIGHLGGD